MPATVRQNEHRPRSKAFESAPEIHSSFKIPATKNVTLVATWKTNFRNETRPPSCSRPQQSWKREVRGVMDKNCQRSNVQVRWTLQMARWYPINVFGVAIRRCCMPQRVAGECDITAPAEDASYARRYFATSGPRGRGCRFGNDWHKWDKAAPREQLLTTLSMALKKLPGNGKFMQGIILKVLELGLIWSMSVGDLSPWSWEIFVGNRTKYDFF